MKTRPRFARSRQGGALLKLVVFLIIFVAIVVSAWIFFLPPILTSTLEKRTGFTVKVKSLAIDPFRNRVEFSGLVISNPSSFARPEFVEVRSFRARAQLDTFFTDRLVIDDGEIDVANVALIRNSEGTINAALFSERLLNARKPKGKPKPAEDPKTAGKPGQPKPAAPADPSVRPELPEKTFLIKRLVVRFEKMIVEDYTGTKPVAREYTLNFAHTYENVINTEQFVIGPFMKGFTAVGSAITGLIPGDMSQTLGEATRSGKELFKEATKKTGDPFRAFMQTLEETNKP
ncbi:hypothetical protein CMV30_10005 [Nibricoccus aquaticus]|uniref:AsmA domain-containing protein n=1 Tax=Nibricoccus aquaticus TaxID=2576891 RepID=A0A290QIU1_9BACT|nr:hypothetical protein [Nibricoccus aquaticus]ATC64261.1 hypothetical protein CMV30_10005 [Nibricoccus aquaticus]